ncbi:PAS domain S-box protein [Candidatus Binatia bacterium]|nr:PAS domain S-box protein [Candidatus Binatia bacterium]
MEQSREGQAARWAGRYDLVVEASPNAMLIVNDAGRIVLVNEAVERLFGYRRDELLGKPVEILVPERFRANHPSNRRRYAEQASARPMGKGRDLHARRKDGSEVPVEIGLNPIVTDEGRFVLSVIIDISERKRAEERFRMVVEAAPNAMIMTDEAGRIVLANSQAEKLFGYTRAELSGMSVERLVPERMRAAHPSERARFAADPKTRTMGAGRDLHALRKDGTEIPVEIGLNPLETRDGMFVLSAIIDITERKRAEEERERLAARERAALAEAREASRAKDEFLTVLSHELRTPLNAILGWSSMLRSGTVSADEMPRAIETIERNARHQTRIVSDILDVSRIIRGRFNLDITRCDPVAIVDTVMNSLRPAARAKRLTLRSTLAPVLEILADAGRLEQIVWNLVSNAIKFTPKGGTVDVELRDLESHLMLIVQDTGQGIAPEFLPHVFDRFSQADSSSTRVQGGLGLGLAIVRHLVELHGGTITAHSAGANQGARFSVMLPLAPSDETVRAENQLAAPATAFELRPVPLDGLKILVVDDEPDTLDLLQTSLSCFGATVVAANGVDDAIGRLASFHPDVVLSDIAMPDQDGFALLRWLEQTPEVRSGRLPVIALTAYAGASDRQAILEAGFRRHVPKPIEPLRLATIITDVLREPPRPVA